MVLHLNYPLAFRRVRVCVCLYGLAFAILYGIFRRVRVCVCLVGFASLQSPWAHTLKASLPCLPLPLHRTSSFLQSMQKNNYPLPKSTFLPFDKHTLCSLALILGFLAKGELLLLSQAQPTIEGSFASNLSACAITSADNPSVTVTKNSILCQIIVILTYKATLKTLCRTVPAPFTQGS